MTLSPMGRLLLLALTFVNLGCPRSSYGDRLRGGECPTGSVCSTEVPGLIFNGPPLAGSLDARIRPFVAGGATQVVFRPSAGSITGFTNASVSNPAMNVTQPVGNWVTVGATRAATGSLRIADSRGLLDTIGVEARALASLRFVDGSLFETGERYAFAPGRQTLSLALLDFSGTRLVDTSVRFLPGSGEFTQTHWDTIEVDMPNEDLTVGVQAGGMIYGVTATAGIADEVGLIEPDTEPVVYGGEFCFRLLAHGAWIVGAEPHVSFDGLATTADPTLRELLPSRHCAHGDAVGSTTQITVSAGPFTTTFTARVE